MIQLNDICKVYPVDGVDFFALDHVSLTVGDGEMIAIMGTSGAGKSTLLHIIGCLDRPTSGSYTLDGTDVGTLSDKKLAELRNTRLGFVMQDFSLINHRTALYNVKAPMLFNDTPFHDMAPRAKKALENAGVADQANKEIVKMSGGQRQRVAIARAIVNDPPVILADEPTGNLDSKTTDDIMALFQTLHKQGKTILIVTHDAHVASFCDRVIELSDGKII